MEPSLFYKRRNNQGLPPISFLFLETLQQVVSGNQELSLELAIRDTVSQLYRRQPAHSELVALAKKLANDGSIKPQAPPPAKVQQSLGTAMLGWLTALPAVQLCLVLAGFDPVKAELLYCDYDHQDVTAMGASFVDLRLHEVQAAYEASLYAFGGSYSGDSAAAGPTNTIDLTKADNADNLKKLRSLGF